MLLFFFLVGTLFGRCEVKYALEFSTLVTWQIAAPVPDSGQWACRCPADGL